MSRIRIDIRAIRCILLGLYIALIIVLLGMFHTGRLNMPDLRDKPLSMILVFTITIVSQATFIFTSGTIDLCRPLKKRRLIIPVIVASIMMGILGFGLLLSLSELFYLDKEYWFRYVIWIFIGLNWIIWGIIFFSRYLNAPRYKILKGLFTFIVVGSLIELLISIPSHIIVSRRPGCFAGFGTMIGIVCGVAVMLWAFGPGIILLFLRERYKKEMDSNKSA
jgi:hypothetical protein